MNTTKTINRYITLFAGLSEPEAKSLYRKLAHQHHPDKGGSTETMAEINSAYKERLTQVNPEINLDIEQDLMDKLNQLIPIEGIEIELLGKWIWVTGNTQENKDKLKKLGLFYAYKKKAWYYRLEKDKQRYSTGEYTLNEIKSKYGSQSVKTVNKLK